MYDKLKMVIGNGKLVVARILHVMLAEVFMYPGYFAFRQITKYEKIEKISYFHSAPFDKY